MKTGGQQKVVQRSLDSAQAFILLHVQGNEAKALLTKDGCGLTTLAHSPGRATTAHATFLTESKHLTRQHVAACTNLAGSEPRYVLP